MIALFIFVANLNSLLIAKCGLTEDMWSAIRQDYGCSTCQCAEDALTQLYESCVEEAQEKQSISKYGQAIELTKQVWIIEINKSNTNDDRADRLLVFRLIGLYQQLGVLARKIGDNATNSDCALKIYYLVKQGPFRTKAGKKFAEDDSKVMKKTIEKYWPGALDDEMTAEEIKNYIWWK
jgi:hypothetical protein